MISDKQHKIKVSLDIGSNIFLRNQNIAPTLKVPYEIRENPVKMTAFNGQVFGTPEKYYSHTIQLEIGRNGDMTMVSCEIADTGKYDIIIRFV